MTPYGHRRRATDSKTSRNDGQGSVRTARPKWRRAASSLKAPCSPWKAATGRPVSVVRLIAPVDNFPCIPRGGPREGEHGVAVHPVDVAWVERHREVERPLNRPQG